MRTWIRTAGLLMAVCLLLYGCSSGKLEAPEQLQEEEPAQIMETEEPLGTAVPEGWHKVDALDLAFYASNDWAEEISTEDETFKTVSYPLSDGQYYTISVSEHEPMASQPSEAAKRMAEELESTDYDELMENDQIQVKEWTNCSFGGQMITYRTRYSKDFYRGSNSGYEDIIRDDTSYGKVLILIRDGKQYDFRITAYRDTEEAFDLFDQLTSGICAGEDQ